MENITEQVDNIVEILKTIDATKVIVLTGNNASGKSLIRKQMALVVGRLTGKKKVNIRATSQAHRTGNFAEFGALSGIFNDTEWTATSTNTLHAMEGVFKGKEDTDYIIIDEPELGIGEELQLGLVDYLNEEIKACREIGRGVMIITHSKVIVKDLDIDCFINIQGLTKTEWLERIPKKISVKDFLEYSSAMFREIGTRLTK
jgi:predicted ATPase